MIIKACAQASIESTPNKIYKLEIGNCYLGVVFYCDPRVRPSTDSRSHNKDELLFVRRIDELTVSYALGLRDTYGKERWPTFDSNICPVE